ncbi:unnamed protein product [Ambrosiozyma monospora]|uniref:Unnamed protein product n=1 Tax=Ambrosiozyma monospora TaxID=43982 RepID=A0ACB5U979_AMBMO|nr:unnamed protein product [Ambrosiozyma monospora]
MVNYWESVPDEFEANFKGYGLTHSNPTVRNELLLMLYELVENNPGFGFKVFLPSVVQLLKDLNSTVVTNASRLLKLFFKDVNPNNRSAKSDLANELVEKQIPKAIANRLLFDIGDQELTQNFNSLNSQHSFVTAGSTKVTTSSFSGHPTHQVLTMSFHMLLIIGL